MKTKIAILVLVMFGNFGIVSAQAKKKVVTASVVTKTDTTKPDTTKVAPVKKTDSTGRDIVPAWIITDSATFTTKTTWVMKVTTYDWQYQQQPSSSTDSFVVKKVRVPKSAKYYLEKDGRNIPVEVLSELNNPYKKP